MRVLELSNEEAAAAYAGKLFARWGWDVVKVESPDRGTPIEAEDLYLNGGKRRVSADYRTPEGRAFLDRLASTCDILVTDASASDTASHGLLGLGGDAGALVRTSITPFGLSGPYARFKATEATLLASSYTFFTGDPGREPLTMPGHYPAYQAGTFAYIASVAAWLRACRGQKIAATTIEISIMECLMSLLLQQDTQWINNRYLYTRNGNRNNNGTATMLPCRDGWFGFSITQDFWMPLALMLGRIDMIEDHPFSSLAGRFEHRDAFEALLIDSLSARGKHEIFTEGQETWRVPFGYTASLSDCLADPHLEARGFWNKLTARGRDGSAVSTPGSPFRFRDEPRPAERETAPAGTHTAEIAAKLPAAPPMGTGRRRPAVHPARPLEGFRILDLTRNWAGPFGARILSDLGADVICIEAPTGRGPSVVPPGTDTYVGGGQVAEPWNQQPAFNKLHRNRRSLAVDLKTSTGRQLFLEIVSKSDVIIENFSARAMTNLNLAYEHLRAANPRIIYLGMPAFGFDGPYRDYVGFGGALEPMSGLSAVMGYSDDEPRISALALPDPIAGVAAAAAVVTALERRERTGLGCHIDFSQHEASVTMLGEYIIEQQLTGHEPERHGNTSRAFAPQGVYRCLGEDNWIALAARDAEEWTALCAVAETNWSDDARFATPEARIAHRGELDEAIRGWTVNFTKLELMSNLLKRGVPAGAVLSPPEYMEDLHLKARGYFPNLNHPDTGPQTYDGWPLMFDGLRGYDQWTPPPKLGEDNASVLHEVLGLGAAEINRLIEQGVIATRPPR